MTKETKRGELGNAARLVARAQNRAEYIDFAESLMIHAAMEEQVLYPAAVLVGEYLKLRLPRVSEAGEALLAGT